MGDEQMIERMAEAIAWERRAWATRRGRVVRRVRRLARDLRGVIA